MSLSVEVAARTDVGCIRKNNEDNFGYDTRRGIFVVCDGMGGAAAGEVASAMGVRAIMNYFAESEKSGMYPQVGEYVEAASERANALASAIRIANQAVHEAGSQSTARNGMGSTIVTALVDDNFFSIAHVGDSRIYLLRNGGIQQLTQDHSLVMEQVRRGMITLEEAAQSTTQNVILRALGPDEEVQPDLDDHIAFAGDTLLLATDGLTKLVSDDEMLAIVGTAPSLEHACEELIEAAKSRGGDDNVTCMLVRIVDRPWYKLWFQRIFGGGSPQWQQSFS